MVLKQFETYDRKKIESGEWDVKKELKHDVLGCWCSPEPCHGDILYKLAK